MAAVATALVEMNLRLSKRVSSRLDSLFFQEKRVQPIFAPLNVKPNPPPCAPSPLKTKSHSG
jgi:hypothetical protein